MLASLTTADRQEGSRAFVGDKDTRQESCRAHPASISRLGQQTRKSLSPITDLIARQLAAWNADARETDVGSQSADTISFRLEGALRCIERRVHCV